MRHLCLFGDEAAFGKQKPTLTNKLHKKCLNMGIFYIQKPTIGTQGTNKISKSLFWGSSKQKDFFL